MWNVREKRGGRVGKLVMKRNEQVLSNTVKNHSKHYKFQDYKNSHGESQSFSLPYLGNQHYQAHLQ